MEFMQLINPYYGKTLLELVKLALAKHHGDRFDVGVGYARNFSGETFKQFGNALDSWLEGDERRRFRLFIGDHLYTKDSPTEKRAKIKACTEVAANLIKFSRNVEERSEIVFVHKLHAKFYSMWSNVEPYDRLEWAIIGSSNLTDRAFQEKNIELDIYLEPCDPQLRTIQKMLAAFIHEVYIEGESWGKLHDTIDNLTAKVRWENDKLRDSEENDAEIEAELRFEDSREAEEQARIDSDRRLGIAGSE